MHTLTKLTWIRWVPFSLGSVRPHVADVLRVLFLVVMTTEEPTLLDDELVAFLQLVAADDAAEALQVVDVVQRAHDEVVGRNHL